MTPPREPTAGARADRHVMAIVASLLMSIFLSALDHTIVSTALPTIAADLGGLDQLSWIVTAYLLTATITLPMYGKISDLYGRRPVYQVSLLLFIGGSVASAAAQSMGQLIAARAVQGAGGGGLTSLAMIIVGDLVSPRERGRYVGYISSVFGLGSAVGPIVGGFFVDHLDWRWIFWVNVPLGLVSLGLIRRNLTVSSTRRGDGVDWAGALLLAVALTSFLLVTFWGGDTYAWVSAPVLGLLAVTVATGAAFVVVERSAPEPLLPPSLFGNRQFTTCGAIAFVMGVVTFGATVFAPLFLQLVLGASATGSGLLLVPLVVGLTVANATSGRLIVRTGRYKVFPVVGTALAAVGTGLLATMDRGTSLAAASVYLLLVGSGIGATMPVMILAVQNAVDVRHLGVATAATQFFRSIGGSVGVTVFGALVGSRLAGALAGSVEGDGLSIEALRTAPDVLRELAPGTADLVSATVADAVGLVFLMAAVVALVGAVLAWTLEELTLRTTSGMIAASVADGATDAPAGPLTPPAGSR